MLGTEVGLAGGVVYYSVEEGVRKDSEHISDFFTTCHRSDPDISECIKKVLEDLRPSLTAGDAANEFFNENWRETFTTYKHLPEEALGTLFKDISNNVFKAFPAKELYPD
ncbi:hypothetical protein C0J52_08561 [Blattella germanica]|nr:hypothetical protein C0J52_08561 [Blattella germanica]